MNIKEFENTLINEFDFHITKNKKLSIYKKDDIELIYKIKKDTFPEILIFFDENKFMRFTSRSKNWLGSTIEFIKKIKYYRNKKV